MINPWEDTQAQRWVEHIRKTVIPMIEGSNAVISIAPQGEPDIKFCVELGLSIMLGKPIIVIARDRSDIPSQLWMIAEAVLIGDLGDPVFQEQIAENIKRRTKDD